jgi:hypothetical protein
MGSWLPWRKLASNPPGLDWPALPWQSRGLYALLLGLANDAGRIPLGRLGLPSLAGGINAPWSEVQPHFDALVSAGWLEVEGSDVSLPHFADSQRAATTAERVAEFRKRARNEPVATEKRPSNEKLPDCNESVTKRELDKKEIRSDQNRSESLVDSEPLQPELALVPQQAAESGHKSQSDKPGAEQSQAKPKRASTHTAVATTLLGELSAARMRVNPRNKAFPPSPAHLREIERCLRDGLTVDQLRNVILVWEEMVKAGKQHPDHFDSLTPFRASNVAKYTEKSLEEARRPWNQAPQAVRPPEPPKSPRAGESDFQRQIRESRERGEIT